MLFQLRYRGLIYLFVILLFSCQREGLYRKSAVLMDTVVTITVVSDNPERAEGAIDEAFKEIKRLEGIVNFYSEESELSLINRNAGIRPIKVSEDMLDILKKSIEVSDLTGGAFDVTTGPLTRLWDFQKGIVPDEREIKNALKYVNYREIVIDERSHTVFLKRKGMLIDLGGIAKGYAADRAADILRKSGIRSFLIAIAGDIRAEGLKPDGKPWMIGIKHPRAEGIIATLPLTDASISTSGDYERFFFINSKRYHHILNPFTGYPSSSTGGVTVITDRGYLSDSLATAAFVLGPEKALPMIERLGYKAVFITEEKKVYEAGKIEGLKFQRE